MTATGSWTVRQIVGMNIVKMRRGAGLSQNALGERLQQSLDATWSRQAVSLAEQGKRAFGVDDLVGLSIALNTTVRDLLVPPAPEVETVSLASGREISASIYKDIVLGGEDFTDEVERSRIIGQITELRNVAAMVRERQASLRDELRGTETDKRSDWRAGVMALSEDTD